MIEDHGMTKSTEAERRKHVEVALADSRIEGYPPTSGVEKEILDAYIRGEIAIEDLVDVCKERLGLKEINRNGFGPFGGL